MPCKNCIDQICQNRCLSPNFVDTKNLELKKFLGDFKKLAHKRAANGFSVFVALSDEELQNFFVERDCCNLNDAVRAAEMYVAECRMKSICIYL